LIARKVFARKGIRAIGHVTPEDIENERRFVALLREAGHPNIIHILDHGTLGNWAGSNDYFIDMERCDVTLKDYVDYVHDRVTADSSPVPVDRIVLLYPTNAAFVLKNCKLLDKVKNICTIGVHIASGLDFLHAQNYVHRDLKPGNGISLIRHADLLSSALQNVGWTMETSRLRYFCRSVIKTGNHY
jgi:serine/threonine protein kinase